MPKRLKLFLPLVLFIALMATFVYTLTKDGYNPRDLPSALVDKPLPAFSLNVLDGTETMISAKELINGKPFLLNVWATWCISCRVEHPYLNQLSQQGIRVVGLDYKDDRSAAVRWLNTLGNPYEIVIFDEQGSLGLDLGVYGAPETYLIDGQGIIRYKHVGVVDENVWQNTIAPLYKNYMSNSMKTLIYLPILLFFSMATWANVDVYQFDNAQQSVRYQHLIQELRCPKCQNQNLADSDAPIAQDLRRELHRMILAGQADGQIVDYMVQRYGNFVLYRPPLDKVTLVLWTAPLLLLLLAFAFIFRLRSKKTGLNIAAAQLSQEEQANIQALVQNYGKPQRN